MCLANRFVKMDVAAPKEFSTEMVIPNKILMGPGPSNYSLRVREALANPLLGQLHPETFRIMDDIKEGSRITQSMSSAVIKYFHYLQASNTYSKPTTH